jgi:hypothetical protein
MTSYADLVHKVEQLSAGDKWRLVRYMLRSLEQDQTTKRPQSDWQQFLRETYGSLRDTPIQRWDQGEYEEREPLE